MAIKNYCTFGRQYAYSRTSVYSVKFTCIKASVLTVFSTIQTIFWLLDKFLLQYLRKKERNTKKLQARNFFIMSKLLYSTETHIVAKILK